MRNLLFIIFIISTTSHASIWDTLFPPKPFESSAQALVDVKEVYQYAVECANSPIPDGVDPLAPTKSPFSACVEAHELQSEFYKKYYISPESIKNHEIELYLSKIDNVWASLP
jgi:hypothetical protein